MLQTIYGETIYTLGLIWQFLLFVWLVLTSAWDWILCIAHPIFKVNTFWSHIGFFLGSLLLSPFPLWTSFIFIFLPPKVAMSLIASFYFLFLFSSMTGVVFL